MEFLDRIFGRSPFRRVVIKGGKDQVSVGGEGVSGVLTPQEAKKAVKDLRPMYKGTGIKVKAVDAQKFGEKEE